MKVLVAGATGAVGLPLVRALCTLGHQVTGMTRAGPAANRLRELGERGLAEVPSTRLIVATARLISGGIPVRAACRAALLGPLTDDPDLLAAMHDLVSSTMA